MFKYIISYIGSYIKGSMKIDAADLALDGAILLLSITIIVLFRKEKRISRKQSIRIPIFVAYTLLVYELTVFCKPAMENRMIRLTPFWTYKDIFISGNREHIPQLIVNVLMFVGIGFLLSSVYECDRFKKVVSVSFCLTIGIEVLQYILKRGLVEFDDIFHSLLGALIGFCFYFCCEKMYEMIEAKLNKNRL